MVMGKKLPWCLCGAWKGKCAHCKYGVFSEMMFQTQMRLSKEQRKTFLTFQWHIHIYILAGLAA